MLSYVEWIMSEITAGGELDGWDYKLYSGMEIDSDGIQSKIYLDHYFWSVSLWNSKGLKRKAVPCAAAEIQTRVSSLPYYAHGSTTHVHSKLHLISSYIVHISFPAFTDCIFIPYLNPTSDVPWISPVSSM